MAKIVGWAKVIETRHDMVTVQHGGGAVIEVLDPSQLGLRSGHQIGLGTKLDVNDDGGLSIPEGTAVGDAPPEPPLPPKAKAKPPSIDDLGEAG